MTIQEQNKALYRQALDEILNKHNFQAVDQYYTDNYIQHNPEVPPGREGFKKFFATFFTAFPDMTATIDHLYAEDDKVFAFLTFQGTHKGEFQGIAPTGKQVTIKTAEIFRVEDGKFAEHWDTVNASDMEEKLGLLTRRQPTGQ